MYAWYLVFFVTVLSNNQQQAYVIYEPTFETKEQCEEWSSENVQVAMGSLLSQYQDVPFALNGVYCGDERAVREIIGTPDVTAS